MLRHASNWCLSDTSFAEDKTKLYHSVPLILASGAFLGVHFGFWVWVSGQQRCFVELVIGCRSTAFKLYLCWLQAVHHTSLTHALLFSSASPLLIAVGTLILRKPISAGNLLP